MSRRPAPTPDTGPPPRRRPSRAEGPSAAEPAGIGSAGARDPLAREVRLLGALLGQVIIEQAGQATYDAVERIRRRAIALRKADDPVEREGHAAELDALGLGESEAVISAFSLYFQLVNLAEARGRVRTLRRRERAARDGLLDDSIAEAVQLRRRAGDDEAALDAAFERLRIDLVLTAHPTEARRRTTLLALRRCAVLLEQLDDPRLTPSEDREIRRRLREEITVMWRTSDLRTVAPEPLDEVRTAMAIFDATLFTLVPRLYRSADAALDAPRGRAVRTGERPPRIPAFLRYGSWIGGDRDGNPFVTAETTVRTVRIQADHVLRGYEAVTLRLMQTESAATLGGDGPPRNLVSRLGRDAEELPETDRQLRRRFPNEPYRQRFGFMVERLRRTRAALTDESGPRAGHYPDAAAFDAELAELQAALLDERLDRVAWGELAELRWQVATFGFHLASLEVRQHSQVHRAALEVIDAGGDRGSEVIPGVTTDEVLATFRAVRSIQARFGVDACRRAVVSFTSAARDVTDVLRLAAAATEGGDPAVAPVLDVVPLFESSDALRGGRGILEALFTDPGYRAHLATRGDRQEVMLGYSDSNKESGFLAAAWMLHEAQASLVEVARRHGIELTLFHGRGGAIGRGGGPANRAILGSAPGAVDGRLKLTEQGEVIAANYADPAIARRHLEQLTGAVLLASTPHHDARAAAALEEGAPILAELADSARDAYRTLVHDDPGFASFFRDITPIAELADLRLGSRPAARGQRRRAADEAPPIDALRAIPWTFAWTQSRIALPGWYGLGTALEVYRARHGAAGLASIARLYRTWPFLASVLDIAELILAKADMGVARRYASLVREDAGRWSVIEAEYHRTVRHLLDVTGRDALLDGAPVLQRSIGLRNPYVDTLSELQVRLLGRLRATGPDDPDHATILRLVQLTVSGVAAGLQTTG